MFDLRRMMLLSDLADLGSVTAVADRRGITNSAVSQQLRVLEDEVGAILFRREGRTLGLTRSGNVLVDHVRVVLAAVDDAMSAVAATEDGTSGQVAVAAFNMGVPMLATPLMQRLASEPDLRIAVQQETSANALRLLRRGEIDVAITCHYEFSGEEPLGGLAARFLLFEPLVLLAPSPTHRRVRSGGLQALADGQWITGPQHSGLDTALLRAGQQAGFAPLIKHRLVGAQNVCELAAAQTASAIVPLLSVPPRLADLVVPDLSLGGRTISAVVREGRQRDPKIALVLRTLRTIAAYAAPAAIGESLGVAS